ncbi:hypothetical protein [Carbonactinospora thermoautotrophica]|uniref:Uncharacterized protein n=1 Tax=Carbonactinospora thermoautotrophica TaxID=1469144 RepID=A0A132MMW8_9ACTN|nr:hypothetical protein [Carbonactinospora thermoautotrophica]KWW99207.1 hypothetical protein LI90_841 [Carbonactinospora thermoautotrophica]
MRSLPGAEFIVTAGGLSMFRSVGRFAAYADPLPPEGVNTRLAYEDGG